MKATVILSENDESLSHYGMPRRSGRYPWGSGEDPHQHGSRDFVGRVDELRKQGFTYTDEKTGKVYSGDTAIAKSMGLTSTQFRTEYSLAIGERRQLNVATAKSLKEDGLSDTDIGKKMGVNESTVRSWLNAEAEDRMNKAKETANFLKARSKEFEADGGMIDVGAGAELELNISKEKMKQALYLLEREGYHVYNGRIPQPTNPGQFTTQTVLAPPDTKHSEIYDYSRVHTVKDYITRDGGETFEKKFHYPASLDSKRLMIRYNEDGGLERDGTVELRRNVDDLSLSGKHYSQVRILVDGSHYIKGMALYGDDKDFPPGVDVIFNTNKKRGTDVKDVLKPIKPDPDNPFGSAIKDADKGGQYWYTDKKTGERKLGLINKRSDEGDWTEWQDALPSQFLGKQSINMAKKQLNLAKADKLAEYDEICALTNPTIKKHLLQKFADGCDSAAIDLKAAALPGQKYHVIIPVNSLKDNEIYAPGYKDGTQLALVRYPHGGTFEIPILKVNNRSINGRKLIGTDSIDAVGINCKNAERLSGADFDGDTVMCIPTHDPMGKVKVTSTPALEGLKDFDPKDKYKGTKVVDPDGTEHYFNNGREYRILGKKPTQIQMGVISNLITDMTLVGAKDDELAAAVRHSMVVIDANKHELDYKQSELDNNIAALHKKYQGKATGGASTILSKAKSEQPVDKRKGNAHVNVKGTKWYDPNKPEGSLVWTKDPDADYEVTKVNKITGEVTTVTKTRQQTSTKMAEADDAYDLVSPGKYKMELVYADYANSMKSLANKARLEMVGTGKIAYSKTAAQTYKSEVISLTDKLHDAQRNRTRERAAIRLANDEVQKKIDRGELPEKSDIKKASQKAVTKYRGEVGSKTRSERNIFITDREWEAIQAGAVSENVLNQILNNTDTAAIRQRATPRATTTASPAKVAQMKALSASNYTLEQIADRVGMSTSAVSKYLKGVK